MRIYKDIDDKWHQKECGLIDDESKIVEDSTIGSVKTGTKPNRCDYCKECFSYLFKSKEEKINERNEKIRKTNENTKHIH